MKRFYALFVLLFLATGLLVSCGHDNNSQGFPYPFYYPGYDGTFLAWTDSSDPDHSFTLVRVDGNTGNVTTIGGFDYIPAMAYGPDGTLYGVSRELQIINPADGTTVTIGSLNYGTGPGAETGILMHGAAFSPDGRLYVVENKVGALYDRVFTVDLSNAALTLVGTPTATIWDLEFASNGTLYGAFGSLHALNPNDMSTIATIGSTGTYILPLTFGGGTMFGLNDQSTRISSLNLSNGWATPVIATGSNGLASLVVEKTPAPVPPPAAGVKISQVLPKQGASAPKSLEKLQGMEKAIRDARKRMQETM